MTARASSSLSAPAATRPTASELVALELWMAAVTKRPAAAPLSGEPTARDRKGRAHGCSTTRARFRSWREEKKMASASAAPRRSEEHTSELQSRENLVCRLLLEKKKSEPR